MAAADTQAHVPLNLIARLREIPADHPMLVCSDFDGTLSPIVTRPEDAAPLPGVDALLEQLANSDQTEVAVVSGRSLSDLKRLSGLTPPIVLVGSHGGEFESGFATAMSSEQTQLLGQLDDALTRLTADAPGTELERKPISIAVHVRQASRDDADRVLAAVREGPALWPGVHATAGKEVLELAVQQVDKGSAIAALRQAFDRAATVVFIGDDVTDERAFEALAAADVGVKVGAGPTAAEYRVESVESVRALLALLAALR